jgi:hypothetical protein
MHISATGLLTWIIATVGNKLSKSQVMASRTRRHFFRPGAGLVTKTPGVESEPAPDIGRLKTGTGGCCRRPCGSSASDERTNAGPCIRHCYHCFWRSFQWSVVWFESPRVGRRRRAISLVGRLCGASTVSTGLYRFFSAELRSHGIRVCGMAALELQWTSGRNHSDLYVG